MVRWVYDLLGEGVPPLRVAALTGVSFSKVYALRREVGGVLPAAVSVSDRFLDLSLIHI